MHQKKIKKEKKEGNKLRNEWGEEKKKVVEKNKSEEENKKKSMKR